MMISCYNFIFRRDFIVPLSATKWPVYLCEDDFDLWLSRISLANLWHISITDEKRLQLCISKNYTDKTTCQIGMPIHKIKNNDYFTRILQNDSFPSRPIISTKLNNLFLSHCKISISLGQYVCWIGVKTLPYSKEFEKTLALLELVTERNYKCLRP